MNVPRDETPATIRAKIEAAVAAKDFATAARLTEALLAQVRGNPRVWLRLARFHAQAGDLAAAVEAIRRGVAAHPVDRELAIEQFRREGLLLRRRRTPYAERDALRAELRTFATGELPAAELLSLVGVGAMLPDAAFARVALERAVPGVDTVKLAQRAAWWTAMFFERAEAGALYAALLARVDDLDGAPAEKANLALTLLFALRSRDRFLATFDGVAAEPGLDPRFAIIARRWRTNLAELLAEPRVIGIGLPKTGTTSLAAALAELGLFHADHHCPITHQHLAIEDVMFFDSISDSFAAHAFETLYALFPNAKFVLTERPEEGWRESYQNHNLTFHGISAFDRSEHGFAAAATTTRHGVDQKLMYFLTALGAGSLDTAYAEHQARVLGFFRDKPAERFLRFDLFAGDGWEKLCRFLGVPTPDTGFPHRNPAQPLEERD